MEHNRKIIFFISFLFSLAVALVTYINSSFLASFIGEKSVGIVYALGSIVSILTLLIIPAIFKKIGGYKFLIYVAFLNSLSFLFLTYLDNTLWVVMVFIAGLSLNTILAFAIDEFLKIFSDISSVGKIRGLYLVVSHIGFIIAQIASGTILQGSNFRIIYAIGFVVMLILALVCTWGLKKLPEPRYDTVHSLGFIKKFFKNKNLSRACGLVFLIYFFYSWMVIYTPIYLSLHLEFSWSEIGIMFAIMLTPFIFLPIKLGVYADRFGERKLLMFGFAITSIATLSLAFPYPHYMLLWAGLLFMTRVGAATVESMADAYFFKHIKRENEEFIGVYRSAGNVAYIIAPLVAYLVFTLTPAFNFLFVVLGTVMLYGIYLASTIRKTDI